MQRTRALRGVNIERSLAGGELLGGAAALAVRSGR